jgi:hypothetical protein
VPRFNVAIDHPRAPAKNLAGGAAYDQSPELRLVTLLLTNFLKDQHYRSGSDALSGLVGAVGDVSPTFAAKAAYHARTAFYMRSVSHVVAVELVAGHKGTRWMRPFIAKVVQRPDDMTEIVAYYHQAHGKRPLPNALKRGLADAFGKFDRYQLARYQGAGHQVKLRDVVNLVHPTPVERNREALEALMNGTLREEQTWEAMLSQAGQEAETEEHKAELKASVWADLINSGKLGYMALVRNLRNIIDQAPNILPAVCEQLVDEKRIRGSKLLPFRFITARDQLKHGASEVVQALNRAAEIALANVPELKGRILVALDGSGSMRGQPIDIGSLFAAALFKRNGADVLVFSDDARYVALNQDDSLLSIQRELANNAAMSGTNFNSVFTRAKAAYDTIVILSDMQGWMSDRVYSPGGAPTMAFNEYRERFGVRPTVFSFDLQGYGTLMFPEPNIYALAGFSDKAFDLMALLQEGEGALVQAIEAIEL